MRHELKVPKAGQLDSVRASRIRKLSSNQLTGFRIRNTPHGSQVSQEFDENAKIQQAYGLENSNQKATA